MEIVIIIKINRINKHQASNKQFNKKKSIKNKKGVKYKGAKILLFNNITKNIPSMHASLLNKIIKNDFLFFIFILDIDK